MSKHGILGILEGAGLIEGEDAPATSVASESPSEIAPSVQPIVQPTQWPTTPGPLTPLGNATYLDDAAKATFKQLESQVYATESVYTAFRRVREHMPEMQDLNKILAIMSAANPSITKEALLAAIDQHMQIVSKLKSDFESQLGAARSQRIDAVTQQITDLQAEMTKAQDVLSKGAAKMSELAGSRDQAQKSLAESEAKFNMIAGMLEQPLEQAKQLLGA